MSVIAIAIINSENVPIYIKTKHDFCENSEDEEKINLLYILHSSLDIVEERQNQLQNRDAYLGLLNQCENYKIYGLLSTTKSKILLMVSMNSNTILRDTEARTILKQIHSTYVDVTTNNPFYCRGDEIVSKKLESVVKNAFVN
ncbi:trafficking protein particle complex subunit 2-like protein [Dinothrombium tinctorium]|uniref:Trafficking protein particle complex subunit 2-like protein n=1 Tax=Dinothrombium tinctorium TaxID=1965070 RepID=A0A3S3NX49_9ACAR|nr:trafficking protein particle complex subunit 2-like protein [Dinothrombium tinctorium]RWS05887.1 trafficking protein particle complex subunit 2-like protein [Dinothrombium tinctorium]RWS05945.1 trafficking protein particle complex subunit 2-like protein [Dinothrombium tinctorium]